MAIEIKTTLNRRIGDISVPMVDDIFMRRDWPLSEEKIINLDSKIREVRTRLRTIHLVHVTIESGTGPVRLYRNLEPSYTEFDEFITIVGFSNCTRLRLSSMGSDTVIHLHISGE